LRRRSCFLLSGGKRRAVRASFADGWRAGMGTDFTGTYSFSDTHSSGILQFDR
jgi:hypothetical protein